MTLAPFFGELAARRLFVVYQLRPRTDGRAGTDKVPVDPYDRLRDVDCHDPAKRLTLAEAELLVPADGRHGVGYVLTEQAGTFFLDLDHCRTADGWAPYVAPVLAQFAGAFVEISSSGDGIHVLGGYTGPRPLHVTRCKAMSAEIYTAARFVALTGSAATGSVTTDHTAALTWLLQWFPPRVDDGEGEWTTEPRAGYGIADDAQLVEHAMRSTSARAAFGSAASFADLWTCNLEKLARAFPPQTAGQNHDGSAADLAFCNHAAFWSGGNCEQVARLLRSSGLARPKHGREDYLRATVLRACASTTSWYAARSEPAAVPAPPTTVGVPTEPAAHVMTLDRKNRYEATLPNLEHVIGAEQTTRVGFDEFRSRIMIARAGTDEWQPLTDDDTIALRTWLERVERFAPISPTLMHDALQLVARRYRFDSAVTWLDGLRWDGVPRVGTFLPVYCGAVDDEYARAVSRYVWTGLAGRVLTPGCQLDMVVALQSPQGRLKSTGLQAMVPDAEHFTDGLSLHQDDDNFKRLIRGKLVVEIAELAGLSRADINVVKRTITRRTEEWIEKYRTHETRFKRRCMLFATTNDERFLPPDETGNRRWLPVEIARIDRERIAVDRVQLWAEGAAIYRQSGIAWADAERLAAGRHQRYEQTDVWETEIERWLTSPTPSPTPGAQPGPPPCTRPLALSEVLFGALRMNTGAMDARAEKRAGRVLRQLGYESRNVKLDGRVARRWVAAGSA
jgi:hypothetical protein